MSATMQMRLIPMPVAMAAIAVVLKGALGALDGFGWFIVYFLCEVAQESLVPVHLCAQSRSPSLESIVQELASLNVLEVSLISLVSKPASSFLHFILDPRKRLWDNKRPDKKHSRRVHEPSFHMGHPRVHIHSAIANRALAVVEVKREVRNVGEK